MVLLIAYVLVNYYAYLQGRTHAVLYSRKGAEAFPWNEHRIYFQERALVCSFFVLGCYMHQWEILCLVPLFIFSFSFWHNGSYYHTRNQIDKPEYHWFYDSKTSTAVIELNAVIRTTLFIISLIALTILTIYPPC
jgi:hypothetical protein